MKKKKKKKKRRIEERIKTKMRSDGYVQDGETSDTEINLPTTTRRWPGKKD